MRILMDFTEAYKPWCGAKDTMDYLREQGITSKKLEAALEESFDGRTPTDTDVNDFLWFGPEILYEFLGLKNPDEDE